MEEGGLVLLTRPQADSEAFADLLHARGLRTLIEPMLTIVPLPVQVPDMSSVQGIVFTSANGIRIFSELSEERSVPVYTVGRESAREAIEAGFETIISGEGGVDGLLSIVDKEMLVKDGRKIVYFSGADTARTFAVPGITVDNIVIYKAEAATTFSPALSEILAAGAISDAAFFSARTAQTFVHLLTESKLQDAVRTIRALCISAAVVECVRHLPWQDVQAAAGPGRRGMLELISKQ